METNALKWEDLDLVAGRLIVRRTLWHHLEVPPRGGRTREMPLSDEAIATLKAHRTSGATTSSARRTDDGSGTRA